MDVFCVLRGMLRSVRGVFFLGEEGWGNSFLTDFMEITSPLPPTSFLGSG